MAVVLGAMVLAVPGTALAKGDHGKGHGKSKAESHQKAHEHGSKKAKKPKTYVFKGVYKGDGVVTVTSGNSRVRKGGYVGQDVTFDLTTAKVVAAESDGVAGVSAADVKAGDLVLVQARLPRGTKAPEPTTEEPPTTPTATESTDDPVSEEAPAAIKARKLVVLSRPSAEDGEPEAGDDTPESEQD
ncbi:MAG TPA: hypothetical protein VFN44_06015 [Solirubrobacteraceae bacterium]|nr:hypothetical protein [Solirubrobacteraceae bacterium]